MNDHNSPEMPDDEPAPPAHMNIKLRNHLRRLAAIIAGAMLLGLLCFVRPAPQAHGERTWVLLWQVTGAEEMEPVTPKWFNESQQRIFVQPIGLPFLEIEQKFLSSLVGNIPPDLIEYFGSVAQWSTRGALMPLDDFIRRDGYDTAAIFPALWEEMKWEGHVYAIPTGTANEAFYWNKQHFREAGLDPERAPATWDELTSYAVQLTRYGKNGEIERAGYVPGYWSPFPGSIFLDWPLQLGARFLDESNRRVTLATPEAIAALEWESKLFERLGREALIRKRASFGYGSQHGFHSGQLSMILQKSSFIQEIEKFSPGLEYGVSILPVPAGGKPAVVAGPAWIGIPKGARNPEAAWEFIKFYTSTQVQLRAARWNREQHLASFFPADIAAANEPEQLALPHMDVFVRSMSFAHSSTVVPLAHTTFWRAYQNAWDQVMRGTTDPRAALTLAEAEVQRALDDQYAYAEYFARRLKQSETKEGSR